MITKKYIRTFILALMAMLGMASYAQQPASSYPDFKQCIDVLIRNRVTYNQYNDSIFNIHDHDKWVNFFLERADVNHQLFDENKKAINTILDYFKKGEDGIPQQAYDSFYRAFFEYTSSNKNDPFLTIELGKILEEHYKHVPDSLNYSNMHNIYMAVCYAGIANLGEKKANLALSYQYLKRIFDDKATRRPYYTRALALSLMNLSKTPFLVNKIQGIKENRACFEQLKKMMAQKDVRALLNANELSIVTDLIQRYDEKLVRNVYQTDSTVMDRQTADSLRAAIIKRNLAKPDLTPPSRAHITLMQVQLNQLTPEAALNAMLKRYEIVRKEMLETKLGDKELEVFLSPYFVLLYLNDVSKESYAKKRKRVLMVCRDMEEAYKRRADQQMKTQYIKYLVEFSTLPRLTKYLKPKERVHFLNTLNVATQVTTYAHSVHVAVLAETLLDGIIRYQPRLLVGMLGNNTIKEVKRHHKQLKAFIHDAAMYHDLGKNSIISVVHNDYRPLTDLEFSIIKKHPSLGVEYLELAPSLAKYRDTTLGHHKWYNGKGGYPEDFDNTKSPVRTLIDIVMLSDCLQAATERVGRNYKGEKSFDVVMKEFRQDAGSRYNPDLVKLIDAHPDLAEKLTHLVEEGWLDIYYQVYRQFIK